jgi:2-polyprenyl-6-methoxyphenol hydroxylase-like FAD-dependent oxidoreductase
MNRASTGDPIPDSQLSTDVLIVGGGPIGLALALHLDMYGVRSTIFNAEPETRWHPKGNIHNARTMELFRKVGIADRIRALGLPGDHPFDVAYFTRLNAYEIARGRTPSRDERLARRLLRPATDQLPEPTHRVNQMYVEWLLFEEANLRPGVTMRFGWTVEDIHESEGGVSLIARATDGRTQSYRAAYVVGCDGSRSTVRKSLGISYEGEDHLMNVFMGGEFVSIHMSIPGLYEALGPRRAWMYLTINPDTRIVIITLNGVDEFMMHKRRTPGEVLDEAAIRQSIQRAIGADIPMTIISQRAWHAGGYLVAECFQRDRVLLAGDAAHLFTPTGGFGLNTGIEDVANLAWKLAAVLQGWGGAQLLETYETERKPIAVRNTDVARGMGKAWHDIEVTPAVERDTPEGAAERGRAAQSSFVLKNHFVLPEEHDFVGVVLGARYDGSPLVVPDGPPPANEIETYTPSSVPGGRAPHLWLDETRGPGGSLFDRLGRYFTLLRFADTNASAIEDAAQRAGIPIDVVDIRSSHARELYPRKLALIRPDQHVAWRGNELPHDADALIAQVTGS